MTHRIDPRENSRMARPVTREAGGHAWWLAVVAVAGGALHAPATQRAGIELPALAREELVAVSLSSNVFRASRVDYADLRVVAADGRPVPFLLREVALPRQATRRASCPAQPPRATETGSNTLELVYALEPGAASPSGLTLETPLRDFRQRVRVETSADGQAWETLTDGAAVYGLARFVDVRCVDVSWPPRLGRLLRVTLLDAQTDRPDGVREVTTLDTTAASGSTVRQSVRREPFRVDRIRFWREESYTQEHVPVLTNYPLSRVSASTRREDAVFLFRNSREPLRRIVFATPSRLFSRSCRLYGRDDGDEPRVDGQPGRLLASGVLTEVRFQEIARTAMTLEFPVSRFREYVLVCDAAGGEAADVTVARAEGPVPQVVFVAAPGGAYALAFGEPAAEAAAMPEAREIRLLLDSGCRPLEARLGAVTGSARTGRGRAWLNSTGAMVGAMAVAGLVLAAILLRAGRRLG